MTQASSGSPPRQAGVDRKLLAVYLSDHVAGSVAGARRMRRTADTLLSTPVGPAMDRVATEVAAEKEVLRGIGERLGMPPSAVKQVATWTAETLGRLKLNGRVVRSSPMTPLLEVEVLRGAVVGKLGIWQTLVELADDLGLDRAELAALVEQTERQRATLDDVHAYLRRRALLGRGGSAERLK